MQQSQSDPQNTKSALKNDRDEKDVIKQMLQVMDFRVGEDPRNFVFRVDDLLQAVRADTIKSDVAATFIQLINSVEANAQRYSRLFAEVIEETYMYHEGEMPEATSTPGVVSTTLPREASRDFSVRFQCRDEDGAMPLLGIGSDVIGKLIKVRGIVTHVTPVQNQVKVMSYTCAKCGTQLYDVVRRHDYQPIELCPSTACQAAKTKGTLTINTTASKFSGFQQLKLQQRSCEVKQGSVPITITLHLAGDGVLRTCAPGDVVTVDGVYVPVLYSGGRQFHGGLLNDTAMVAHVVTRDMDKVKANSATATVQEIDDDIKTKLTGDGSGPPMSFDDMYNFAAHSTSPNIFGHRDVKKALLLLLIGGVERTRSDGMVIRGDINICLMGDPGCGKSQMLRHLSQVTPRCVYTTGKSSSGVGLTAAVVRDPLTRQFILEGGALVLADQGVCCFPAHDHELLTNRGFLTLDEVTEIVSADRSGVITAANDLKFAVYDQAGEAMRYETPSHLIVNTGDQTLVEFTTADCLDQWPELQMTSTDTFVGDHHKKGTSKSIKNISVVATSNHDMFVRTCATPDRMDEAHRPDLFHKVKAGELIHDDKHETLRFQCGTTNGLATATNTIPAVEALNLTPEQIPAFLEFYGFWLGDGSLCSTKDNGCNIRFEHDKEQDNAWLIEIFNALKLEDTVDYEVCPTKINMVNDQLNSLFDEYRQLYKLGAEPLQAKSGKWLADWVFTLDRPHLDLVLKGLVRADGHSTLTCPCQMVFTSSFFFRDQLIHVLTQAGYTAKFGLAYDRGSEREINGHTTHATQASWVVSWTPCKEPTVRLVAPTAKQAVHRPTILPVDHVVEHEYSGRTWCVRVPTGTIIVRRARRGVIDGETVVLQASRPTIQGNCIDEFDKMDDGDRGSIYEVMEQQKVSIAKGGIVTKLNARASIVAAANPAWGRYDPRKTAVENVNLPPALLSRFDLLFLIVDTPDAEADKQIAHQVMQLQIGSNAGKDDDFHADQMRHIIQMAKKYQPAISWPGGEDVAPAIAARITDYYLATKRADIEAKAYKDVFITPRMLQSVTRLAMAHARLRSVYKHYIDPSHDEFSVEDEDVNEAMRLMDTARESFDHARSADTRTRRTRGDAATLVRTEVFRLLGKGPMAMDDLSRAVAASGRCAASVKVVGDTVRALVNLGQLVEDGAMVAITEEDSDEDM